MEKHSSTGGTSGIGETAVGRLVAERRRRRLDGQRRTAGVGEDTSEWARVRPAGRAATVSVAGPAAGARR